MIKLVIFDLDDTLIDTWNASFPLTLYEAIKAMKKEGLNIESEEKEVQKLKNINEQSKNTSEALTNYLKQKGKETQQYVEIGKRVVYNYNFEDKIKAMPGAQETITKIETLGIPMAIVTRGGEQRQLKRLQQAGIDRKKFSSFTSVDFYDKTQAYQDLLKKLGVKPKETVVVGDRYEGDLLPAKKLGATTIWIPHGRGNINPAQKGEVEYTITKLTDIINIIKEKSTS